MFEPIPYALVQYAAPATEPVTRAQAKVQCRIPVAITDDDDSIDAYISAARNYAEQFTGRRFVTQTWDVSLDEFPIVTIFDFPFGPLQSVTSISYLDSTGATTTLATTAYGVDAKSFVPRIYLKESQIWPVTQLGTLNAVTIRAVVGYGAYTAIPPAITQAILSLVALWYNLRLPISDVQLSKVPFAITALLTQHKASWV